MGWRWEFIRERLRFRFSLRGLMVFTFGVAVGLALVDREKPDWPAAALNALTVWLVLGLINQARDLWTTFRGRTDLDFDERWTWRMAAAWRLLAALMLVGLVGLDLAMERGLFRSLDEDYFYPNPRNDSVRAAYWMLIVIALFPIVHANEVVWPQSGWRLLWTALIVTLGGMLATHLWADMMFIPWLVYLAIQGIEHAEPLRLADSSVTMDASIRAGQFLFRNCVAMLPRNRRKITSAVATR